MGDYAFYVWGSYVLTLIALGGEVLVLLRRQRSTTAEDAEDAEGKSLGNPVFSSASSVSSAVPKQVQP